jgi:hypothetical protein
MYIIIGVLDSVNNKVPTPYSHCAFFVLTVGFGIVFLSIVQGSELFFCQYYRIQNWFFVIPVGFITSFFVNTVGFGTGFLSIL